MTLNGEFTDAESERELFRSAILGDPGSVGPAALAEIGSLLEWSDPRHEAIASAILAAVDRGDEVSLPNLRDALHLQNGAAADELVDYLASQVVRDGSGAACYPDPNPARRGRDLRDLSCARTAVSALSALLAEAKEAGSSAELARRWISLLGATVETAISGRVSSESSPLCGPIEELTSQPPQMFRTMIPMIDNVAPMSARELVVLAGVPGAGKTSLALLWSIEAARQGCTVLFFSLEMSRTMLHRWAAAQVQPRAYGSRAISPALAASAELELAPLPIRVVDAAGLTLSMLRARCAAAFRAETRPGLIVIDHVQRVTGERRRNEREEREIAGVVRALKTIADERRVVVLALSQLNRAGYVGRPAMQHLRETGVLEQDADKVLMLWRPDAKRQDLRQLSIVKNRNGEVGHDIDLMFSGANHVFHEKAKGG
jgi:KaiC/GvpD/RAD55 family RecA-like ATPase